MPQKVCPRCGAQYATLKSATCPQCFAKLIEVDDETAAEMAAARAAIEKSPEYQQAKAEEDEKFRHQSFQACLAVVAMAIAIAVLAVALLVTAKRREQRMATRAHSVVSRPAAPAPQARVEDVMPATVGSFQREKMDERAALSGTVTLIYHAAYVPAAEPNGSTFDVYAIPLDRPAAELARFRDVVQLAALAGTKPRPVTEVTGKPFLYEIVGAAGGNSVNDDFNRAWKSQVGAS
jgi:hypothetical protein